MRSPLFDPANQWVNRFGTFVTTGGTTRAAGAAPVDQQFHAEAQRSAIVAADFEYEARITMAEGVEPHLQCRISDEGRYGVRLQANALTFYRFSAAPRPCAIPPADGVFAHCPNWMAGEKAEDALTFQPLASYVCALPAGSTHTLRIVASGARFEIFLDDVLVVNVRSAGPRVGRFGLYVFGAVQHIPKVAYRNLQAFVDPSERSNFALLYSTCGYERKAPKRALVRTLNELPVSLFDDKHSTYRLIDRDGAVVLQGPLQALPWGGGAPGPAKTFGMQLWEADFTKHTVEGVYTLVVDVATSAGVRHLSSEPFVIQTRLITTKMLTRLAMRNAEARRAADEDMRRNWIRASGAWSVGLDGAFVADRANDGAGALLLRVFDTMNQPCNQRECRIFARVTIVSGCDAQVQFRIGPAGRLAVTLQAGAPGGCAHAEGPGAVRLHRELPNGQLTDERYAPFAPDKPFRPGEPYDVDIQAVGNHVTVNVRGPDVALTLSHDVDPLTLNEGTNGFGLKAWGATVRFENVQAWHPDVVFRAAANGTPRPLFKNWVDGGEEYVAVQSLTHLPRNPVSPAGTNSPAILSSLNSTAFTMPITMWPRRRRTARSSRD